MARRSPKSPKERPDTVDFDVVAKIGLAMPGVDHVVSARGSALKIGGKLLACEATNKSAEPDSLMVRIGVDERELLLATEPDTYYLTDHYRGYPAILVRLSKISRDALGGLLESAAQFVTAKKR
jgi:hypothetical protein